MTRNDLMMLHERRPNWDISRNLTGKNRDICPSILFWRSLDTSRGYFIPKNSIDTIYWLFMENNRLIINGSSSVGEKLRRNTAD